MTIDTTYYTPREIAALLKVSRSRAYQIARELPRLRFGKTVRVAASDLKRWLAEHVEQPAIHASTSAEVVATWPRKRKPRIGVPRAKAKELRERPLLIRPTRQPT